MMVRCSSESTDYRRSLARIETRLAVPEYGLMQLFPSPVWTHGRKSAASGGSARQTIAGLLCECGVQIDGRNTWDIRVLDERFYDRVLANGSLGLGEAYMDGWWEARDLDGFIFRLLNARLDQRVWSWRDALAWGVAALSNLQRVSRAFQVGERHYDLGNEFYEGMLDRRMIYSCAYWENATTLDKAQQAKLELVFGKLGLEAGQRVLDVGCGWGGALRYAAERHGVSGVGVTIAREQAKYARKNCAGLPLEIRLQDYRSLGNTFDHIYSIGMFEHVGVRNYRTYMKVMRRCLRPGGRFLLHTIGGFKSTNHIDPWMNKYIFPNAVLPSQQQIIRAIDGLFIVDGWQRIGPHYDPTLLAWRANFERLWARGRHRFDERFRRMWHFYLSACAASFRAGTMDVWQVLLVPAGRGA
jgi:cyclopropane-fatty-acyl-phospholipid synthase